jgi:hypothetical protein
VRVIAAALAAAALVASPVRATLAAPGHTPKVNTKWRYTLRVTQGGKPVSARLTAQIVDPIGGVHTVQFGSTTRDIKNFPIKGVFRDYVIWPRSSDGIPLTLRFLIRAGGKTTTLKYHVTPHA